MSYPIELDEHSDEALAAEVQRRAECRDRDVCPYCHAAIEHPPCRFPRLHVGWPSLPVRLRPPRLPAVLAEVAAERARQDARWGQQDHPDHPPGEAWAALGRLLEMQARSTLRTTGGLSWAAIAAEEVGEALNAPDVASLRGELVQVAAVAVAWIEAIDRRGGR